jgi:hypothetical protein
MINFSKNSLIRVFALMIFMVFLLSLNATAQELEKKYAPILGDYEFDLTDLGMGVVTVKFYVENDELWAWPDNADEPGLMVPVEDEEFMFTVDAGDQGVYELEFMKDESGEYTKCRVKNEAIAMDVIGEKIKE